MNHEDKAREDHFGHGRASHGFTVGIEEILEVELSCQHGHHSRYRCPNGVEGRVLRQQHVKGQQIADPDEDVNKTEFEKR